jgi:hypothetical protein
MLLDIFLLLKYMCSRPRRERPGGLFKSLVGHAEAPSDLCRAARRAFRLRFVDLLQAIFARPSRLMFIDGSKSELLPRRPCPRRDFFAKPTD